MANYSTSSTSTWGAIRGSKSRAQGDWLAQTITQGAELAHEHYHAVIEHYDLAKGVKNPTAGMDQHCKDRIAKCLGHAVVGLARALERAFEESEATPPHVELTLQGFVATLAVPIRYVLNQIHDLHERLVVEAIYDEVQRTGKVLQNLPEDDRTVRQLHADEVLKIPLKELDAQPAGPTGAKHGQGQAERHLPNQLITSPVIDTGSGAESSLRPRGGSRGSGFRVRGSERESGFGVRGSGTGSRESGVGSRILTRRASEESDAKTPIASEEAAVPNPEPKRESVPKRFDVQPPAVSAPTLKSPAAATKPPEPKVEPKAFQPPKAVPNPKSEPPPATIPLKFRLEPRHPVVDAPSIGSKTAGRLEKAGIMTVADLLAADPEKLAAKLNVKHITPQTIRTWQAESTLVCRVPELYGHDAQILVASGVTDPAEAASLTPEELLELVTPFVKSVDGQRLLRSSSPPDLAEVTNWIGWCRQARVLQAAA